MPPKSLVDLTDNVKFCMVYPDTGDDVSARKQLRYRRKDEVAALYNQRSIPTKVLRDPAHAVLHNVFHQQVEPKTQVPIVYKLLGNHYGCDGDPTVANSVPLSVRKAPPQAERMPSHGTQTIVGTTEPLPTPPQRVDPKVEDILHAAKSVRPKSSLGIAHYDQATGREVKSIAVGATPSDIIRSTMRSTSRPTTAGDRPVPKPSWIPTRSLQTNTDAQGPQWDRSLSSVPKMGTLTLQLQKKSLPGDLIPGPKTMSARHAQRPRDTIFIF